MKLLIAEDDDFFQKVLRDVLGRDYELVAAHDGNEAWALIQRPDAPRLAILDWVMPGLSGPEVCRKVRACPALSSMYLIILTAKNNEADIVSGLRAGADDYITKPPMPAELRARVRVGERVLLLQDAVEVQSGVRKGFGRETLRLESDSGTPSRSGALDPEPLRGIESCWGKPRHTGNCCSISEAQTNRMMGELVTPSQENRHPNR